MQKQTSTYLLFGLVTVLIVLLYMGNFSGMQKLQWRLDSLLYSFRGDKGAVHDIVLLNIDDAAVKEYGEWPWSYARLADLVAVCNTGEAKTVLLNFDLYSRTADDTLGNTRILANQVSWAKKLVLTYDIATADYVRERISKPEDLWQYSLRMSNDLGMLQHRDALNIRKLFLPSELIHQYSDGMGFVYTRYDDDRKIRWMPLAGNFDGFCYPSAPLMTAMLYLGGTPEEVVVDPGHNIKIGVNEIPVDETAALYINFNKPNQTFKEYSALDFLNESVKPAALKNKLVIIGYTGSDAMEYYNTPVSAQLSRSELFANVLENILHENYITQFELAGWLNVLLMVVIGAFCAYVMPRVSLFYRIIIPGVLLLVVANVTIIMFNSYGYLFRPLYLSAQLLLILACSPLLNESRGGTKQSKLEAMKLWSFGKKGEDPAEKARKSAPGQMVGSPVMTNESNPSIPLTQTSGGMPAETQQYAGMGQDQGGVRTEAVNPSASQPTQMTPSPAHPVSQTPGSGGINLTPPSGTPLNSAPQPTTQSTQAQQPRVLDSNGIPVDTPPLAQSSPHYTPPPAGEFGSQTPVPVSTPPTGTDSIRNLGRYQVLGSLGHGAMGTVLKGVDPAINRHVALKTIRLDFVSDEKEMSELRDRLFREAQAAGKLSHPNIVTIYDVGSEGSLQYIAMEYIEGQTLEVLIKKQMQFSYKIIARIISQISQALDYAHDQGIVHRDIKPANVMVMRDYTVKVMDFGIARVDTSSMTKTGIAMGTPNYIAPELLQGKPVDRRADIYSLGVVVYELLTGRRPFKGENLTGLIYSIVNDEPPPPSTINDNIPLIFDHICAKALAKDPLQRYQRARDLRAAVADFEGSFVSK